MTQEIVASTNEKSKRIRALDIIRGIFLIVILVNHIELYPSFFDFLTGRGRLLVSAAEGFFFMSGLLVGMVYRRRLQMGMKFIFKKMWGRAAKLYAGSVVLTLLFTAVAVYFNHPSIKDGLAETIDWPHIILQTLALRYGFGWADFLMRFAILMLLAPFGFYLLAKGKWWLLALLSLGAWLIRGDNFTLSWQIIFTLGMMSGFYWNQLQHKLGSLKPAVKRQLTVAVTTFALITFALSYASVYFLSKLNQWLLGDPQSLSAWWQVFTIKANSVNEYIWFYAEKWNMGPLRIILFLAWFTLLFMLVQRYEHRITRLTRGTVELLGRNSLFVYINHAFIVFAFKFFIPPNTNIYQNFVITGIALALMIATSVGYTRLAERRKLAGSTSSGGKNRKYYTKPALR
jgi:hypothetical protein